MPRGHSREFSGESSDYKRKRRNNEPGENGESKDDVVNSQEQPNQLQDTLLLNDKAHSYLDECFQEKTALDKKFPVCKRLLDDEIEKILVSGRIPKPEIYANVYNEKPIRVAQKVLFPIKEYPKFNFVGKILGPKGNTLRQLQEETYCKMIVMGRNSMRDPVKEEELRNSSNSKYAHLNRDLHVEISTVAPPAEAYQRLAYALAEVRKFMIPDANDDIRMEQMREIDSKERSYKKIHFAKPYGDRLSYRSRTPPRPSFEKASRPKVYSILEKARYVMEDPSLGIPKSHRSREHDIYQHPGEYNHYCTPPPQTAKLSNNHHASYDGNGNSYEHDYRREYHSQTPCYSGIYAGKPSSSRSSLYRPRETGSQSSAQYDTGSRSAENLRYRWTPYQKLR